MRVREREAERRGEKEREKGRWARKEAECGLTDSNPPASVLSVIPEPDPSPFLPCHLAFAGRALWGHSTKPPLPSQLWYAVFLAWWVQLWSAQTLWQVSLQPSRVFDGPVLATPLQSFFSTLMLCVPGAALSSSKRSQSPWPWVESPH